MLFCGLSEFGLRALGGDMSGVLAACGLRNCVETRNNPG